MIIVLNEWIFHDLLGENGSQGFEEAAEFLLRFRASVDRLVIPDEKRWTEKSFRLMRLESAAGILASRRFHSLRQEAGRLIRVGRRETEMVPRCELAGIPEEDIYLVEAYLATGADMLVTTDRKLFDALASRENCRCQMRGDFLSEYGVRSRQNQRAG